MTADLRHPEVLSTAVGPVAVVMELWVPAELQYFRGHFPGRPILPGVVQLAWAIGYAQEHFRLDTEIKRFVGLKFSRVIRPGARLRLDLDWSQADRCLSFRFSERDSTCSSGRFIMAQ